jgi:DNA-directed RNA polymerase specialized sigma24 family protein
MPSTQNDPSLRDFLEATTDREAQRALEALLTGESESQSRDTVARQLGRSRWMTDHLDDVLAELRVGLTQKLWSLRAGVGEPVENFRAYFTTAAKRTCYTFLRRQFPERTRLRNRIRYAVTHHAEMTLEEDVVGIWRCRSTAITTAPQSGSTQALLDSPQSYALGHRFNRRAALPALLASVLSTCDQPVDFDRLVDAIAAVLGISDKPPARQDSSTGVNLLEQVPDPATPINTLLEQRASLEEVWQEVLALPPRQRTALLLNLRDPDDGATMPLLPAASVVTMTHYAAALEIPESELAGLWEALPLDDLTIAGRIGATRQQVINLRKSARARLARRLGKNVSSGWLL